MSIFISILHTTDYHVTTTCDDANTGTIGYSLSPLGGFHTKVAAGLHAITKSQEVRELSAYV